jgi:nitrite reductase (NADH) small subunit
MNVSVKPQVEWIEVCTLSDIPLLGSRVIKRKQGGDIALFRAGDNTVFALLDACPHKGGPLSQGIVFGHSVSCPLHQWNISLADGQAHAPDQGCAASFVVYVKAERIYLDLGQVQSLGL